MVVEQTKAVAQTKSAEQTGLAVAQPLVGVVHLRPLPGAPRFDGDTGRLVAQAVSDAEALAEGGVDAVMIENFGDTPFFSTVVPRETIAWMTRVGMEIRARIALPLGVCVLRNDGRAALAIAHAIGASFIRVCILGSPRVTDQGLIEGDACNLLRDRARLGAEVRIWADVNIKDSYALAPSYSLDRDAADLVARSHADALIVTGAATGLSIQDSHLTLLHGKVGVPVLVGSGVTERSVGGLVGQCDGFIVGTALKDGSEPDARISAEKTRALRNARDAVLA
ncbi:BtpA/SgcQ family protein [Aureimonas glaciei]|uniref:Phosphorybosylanthranilate isomerase n=1 Tax=Aureimonas glaciei TaxID=1776957 RepID=A0A916XZR6_9HYPH|nr:BtpA/SgcQ family protein [Aureimonas glaciei]GGD23558.1 phosphorybosylanthranilate isomerase [Aureimonas glaciei]